MEVMIVLTPKLNIAVVRVMHLEQGRLLTQAISSSDETLPQPNSLKQQDT